MLTNYTTGAGCSAASESSERAHRIIAAGLMSVKQLRYFVSKMTWKEVLFHHKTLRGIGRHSLLVDRGESGYRNRFLPDGSILYPGEGLTGHQQPLGGNLTLLNALACQTPMRVFLRKRPDCWQDLGLYRVESVEHRFEETERRYVYWFRLVPLKAAT